MVKRGVGKSQVLEAFRNCLQTKTKRDGNVAWIIAKGDCAIMLGLIRMKLNDFEAEIDTRNPGRFRGDKQLRNDFFVVLGSDVQPHLPKWGASHFRGDIRNDSERGNKRHIASFIELLNQYSGNLKSLETVHHECIRLHQEFWDQFSISVVFQPSDELQSRVVKLLDVASLGRVQQGLIYSALRRRYGDECRIITKKTFAADKQSSTKGRTMQGDVQVCFGNETGISIEIKDAVVDERAWERVKTTHGEHDYALFLLATRFNPPKLQREISSNRSTYALHLLDFFLTTIFITATDEQVEPKEVLTDILNVYNREFCGEIESDTSIMIKTIEDQ